MDGEVFPVEWSEARIADSEALFARRGERPGAFAREIRLRLDDERR